MLGIDRYQVRKNFSSNQFGRNCLIFFPSFLSVFFFLFPFFCFLLSFFFFPFFVFGYTVLFLGQSPHCKMFFLSPLSLCDKQYPLSSYPLNIFLWALVVFCGGRQAPLEGFNRNCRACRGPGLREAQATAIDIVLLILCY